MGFFDQDGSGFTPITSMGNSAWSYPQTPQTQRQPVDPFEEEVRQAQALGELERRKREAELAEAMRPSFDQSMPQLTVPPRSYTGGQSVIDTFFPDTQPTKPTQPSIMERIWGSLGLKSDDVAALTNDRPVTRPGLAPPPAATLTGPYPSPPQLPTGMDLAGDQKPVFDMRMPPPRPEVMVDAPLPQPRPDMTANLGPEPKDAFGFLPDQASQRVMSVRPSQQAPGILPPQTAAPAPTPPGAAPTQPLQQNFLERLLGGKRGVEQVMAGIGRGAAAIQGPGRFASAARGAGLGIEGSQGRGDTQFKQQLEANRQKLAIDTFETRKPVWMAQADYFKARADQQKALASGVSASKAWQTTPQGLARLATQDANALYRERMMNLRREGNRYNQEELVQQEQKIEAQRERDLQDAYRKYGIDPKNNGMTPETAMDATRLNPMQMMGMPHGTYYIVPGSQTKDNPRGVIKMRDWNVLPPPGYAPGVGWNAGE